MSIFFEYSTILQNAYQKEVVKISEIVNSTEAADYNPYFSHTSSAGPTDEQMFYAVLNPGHAGTTSLIEYSLKFNATLDSYKWQIKPSGGAWGNLTTGTTGTEKYGSYTTAVLLPAEIQLLVTKSSGTVTVTIASCMVRCIGTV